ncbi:MAG: hypothetical protein ACRBCT_02040 [Alphaproteobacteria bacterium]
MAKQETVKIDPKELENAEKLWVAFGAASKWTMILIIVVLSGLGIAFL